MNSNLDNTKNDGTTTRKFYNNHKSNSIKPNMGIIWNNIIICKRYT